MKIMVTGGAGFIGSHLVDRLLKEGNHVIVLDNLESGEKGFIEHNLNNKNFEFHKVDILEDSLQKYFKDVDEVWHLAANPNVRITDSKIHIKQNVEATTNVMDAMKMNDVKKIFFTSSSAVYGEAITKYSGLPTNENAIPLPSSVYGASKLASEAMISAYCQSFGMKSCIFRLANVIGPRSTHGVIFDFMKKLDTDPKKLEILGDGKQKKSYLYIDDCIDAFMIARKNHEKNQIYNIGSDDWIEVESIAKLVCESRNLKPEFVFTGGRGGWAGDVPLMRLDNNKIKKLGFEPKHSSVEAVKKTIESFY